MFFSAISWERSSLTLAELHLHQRQQRPQVQRLRPPHAWGDVRQRRGRALLRRPARFRSGIEPFDPRRNKPALGREIDDAYLRRREHAAVVSGGEHASDVDR